MSETERVENIKQNTCTMREGVKDNGEENEKKRSYKVTGRQMREEDR